MQPARRGMRVAVVKPERRAGKGGLMAERDRRDNREGPSWEPDLDPNSPARAYEGYGATSPGLPPRHVGGAPGFGSYGMGYGPESTSQMGSFGAYGLARETARDYTSVSRTHEPGQFD